MWDKEATVAEDLLKRAGLGERLLRYTSPDGKFVCLSCDLPYLRFGANPEYVTFTITMTPGGHISAFAMLTDTGRRLKVINLVPCNVEGATETVQELLTWWKENRQKPGLA